MPGVLHLNENDVGSRIELFFSMTVAEALGASCCKPLVPMQHVPRLPPLQATVFHHFRVESARRVTLSNIASRVAGGLKTAQSARVTELEI